MLRRALLQIQAELHPVRDAEALAEFERIILRRIAVLRLLESPPAPLITESGATPSRPSPFNKKMSTDNAA
jgi:hypothetical protein